MSRLHPFDMVFGDLAEARFGEIRGAVGDAISEARDRRRFLQAAPVQRLLSELAPPAETPLRAAIMEEHGTLLFAAYHYWAAGGLTLDVTAVNLDRVAGRDTTSRPVAVPRGACYLRLPERHVWAQIAADAPHEPLDGLFVVAGADDEVTVAAVLGLRTDRTGFSQLAVSAPAVDIGRAGRFRRDPLFGPLMEGGARAGFRSLATEGELLHLAHLALIITLR